MYTEARTEGNAMSRTNSRQDSNTITKKHNTKDGETKRFSNTLFEDSWIVEWDDHRYDFKAI
jgi:hypothetical protein